jgi:hypothetical protein
MKQKLGLSLAVLFAVFGAIAVPQSDTALVNITIASIVQLTVTPDSLNWTNLNPGSSGGEINVTLRNSGSVNLTLIHAYVNTNETESVRPYQFDVPGLYSSGGLLVLSNASTGGSGTFNWVQRKEWNWTSTITTLNLTAINNSDRAAYGFFRNASYEYVWAIGNGTFTGSSVGCNNSDAVFAIEDDSDLGTVSTRSPTITGITRNGGDAQYSYFSVNRATAPINGMCVAVHYNCTYILAYKYDMRTGYSTCSNAARVRPHALAPGETMDVRADARAPFGIPDGQLAVATLTFEGTAQA